MLVSRWAGRNKSEGLKSFHYMYDSRAGLEVEPALLARLRALANDGLQIDIQMDESG
jgi:hypothetical protein